MNEFLAGWQSELEVALSVKKRIFLHGNVFDVFHHDGRMYNLSSWLLKVLLKRDYELVMGYDVVDGETVLHGDQNIINEIINDQSPDDGGMEEEPGFNEPSGFAQGRNPRISDPGRANIAAQLQRLRLLVENEEYPTALILTHCDKLVAHGKLFNPQERKHSVLVSKLSERAWDSSFDEQGMKAKQNLVILIYDQEGLMPVELYLNDPIAKAIHVSYPDFGLRSKFFMKNWTQFVGSDTLLPIEEFIPEGDEPGRLPVQIKNYESFARLTEGFTMRELFQLALYSQEHSVPITDFRQLLSNFRSGVRVNPWNAIDGVRISNATGELEGDVVGQREAIQSVVDMLHRAKAELSRVEDQGIMKPRGVLFFVGPTGVGKTMLARKLAKILFDTEEACTVFDMSEFKEEHTVSRLIGAPPGYIGHDTGGQLTNKLRERPFSVLLFDEIEKANKRILDIFLQVLDSGRLTDGKGQTVSFAESVIIFTSNIGAKVEKSKRSRFRAKQPQKIETINLQDMDRPGLVNHYTNAVEMHFAKRINRPELYNRLGDNIIVFNYLRKKELLKISQRVITNYFENIRKKWREKHHGTGRLEFSDLDGAIKNIQAIVIDEKYILRYGARGLENKIISKLETPLAILFNSNNLSENLTCELRIFDNNKITIETL